MRHKLTATAVKLSKAFGQGLETHRWGRALSLCSSSGGKYWRFDYRFGDKRKTLALGVYPDVSLADARASHQSATEQLSSGIDPSEIKRVQKLTQHLAATDSFEAVAREWFTPKDEGKIR